jgi:hypothetical protein
MPIFTVLGKGLFQLKLCSLRNRTSCKMQTEGLARDLLSVKPPLKLLRRSDLSLDPVSMPPNFSYRDRICPAPHCKMLPSVSENALLRQSNQQNISEARTRTGFPMLSRGNSIHTISPLASTQNSRVHGAAEGTLSGASGANKLSVEEIRTKWRSQQIANQEKNAVKRFSSWSGWCLQGATPLPGIVHKHRKHDFR